MKNTAHIGSGTTLHSASGARPHSASGVTPYSVSGTTSHSASGTTSHTGSGTVRPVLPPVARTAALVERTAAEWLGLVALALFVLLVGAVVGVVGPLLSIACDACQDGVRGPLRFAAALVAPARFGVPLVTLGTVVGVFHPRGGARAGGIGLGLLGVLLCAILALGRITA